MLTSVSMVQVSNGMQAPGQLSPVIASFVPLVPLCPGQGKNFWDEISFIILLTYLYIYYIVPIYIYIHIKAPTRKLKDPLVNKPLNMCLSARQGAGHWDGTKSRVYENRGFDSVPKNGTGGNAVSQDVRTRGRAGK